MIVQDHTELSAHQLSHFMQEDSQHCVIPYGKLLTPLCSDIRFPIRNSAWLF